MKLPSSSGPSPPRLARPPSPWPCRPHCSVIPKPEPNLDLVVVLVLILIFWLLLLLLDVVLLLLVPAPVLGLVILVLVIVALVVVDPAPYFPLLPVNMSENERASKN